MNYTKPEVIAAGLAAASLADAKAAVEAARAARHLADTAFVAAERAYARAYDANQFAEAQLEKASA